MPRRAALLASLLIAGMASGCTVNLYFYLDGTGGAGGTGGYAEASSTASTGSGGECIPGSIVSCYSGPAGTENKGLCQSGSRTCDADGSAFGPCSGEVLPTTEDCATATDEDCDGLAPPCNGAFLWGARFGDASDQLGKSVAVDGPGNVLLAGDFGGTVDFGGGPLVSAGASDVSIAKFSASGILQWSKRFGDSSDQYGNVVAADESGNIVLTGSIGGTVDFGGGPLTGTGSQDSFIAKFDAAGNHAWSKRFTGFGRVGAAFGAGDVLVAGSFSGSLDLGGGAMTSAGASDIYIARFGPTGNHVWSKRFGDAGNQYGEAIATDATGAILATGSFGGTVDFGGGPLTSKPGIANTALYLAKLDATGAHVWSKRFGETGKISGARVAVDAAGNVVVAGSFSGSVDFGGGVLTSAGSSDIFIAKFYASGAHWWSKRFGDSDIQTGAGVATDGDGDVVLVGGFIGVVDFGAGQYVSAGVGSADMYIAKFDANGKHLWSKRFGDGLTQGAADVATDAAGDSIVTGQFSGAIDFGGGSLMCAGQADAFLVEFEP